MSAFPSRLLTISVLLASVTLEAAENRPLDILHYDLLLDIQLEKKGLYAPLNELSGQAVILMRNTSESSLTEIPLILHRLMKIESLRDGKGNPLDYKEALTELEGWENFQVNAASAALHTPLIPGGELSLQIEYKGQLTGYPESGMLYVRETLDPEFTIIRYETFSYPQVSAPSQEAVREARGTDFFDYRFTATVPKGHVVAHGSRLVERQDTAETTTFTYESTRPESVMMFPIAPYQMLGGGAADFIFFAEDAVGARRLAQAAELTFALFENWFGKRMNSEDRITFIEIPAYFGSQASSPTIIQTSAAYKDDSRLTELYHEISHLWNPYEPGITPSRWNEGFATFLQYLTDDHFRDSSALEQQLDRLLLSTQNKLDDEPAWRELPMKEFGSAGATSLSYSAGGLFFALIHRTLGNDAFLEFYKDFYKKQGRNGATATDFARYAESYGNTEITTIFGDWMLSARWAEDVAVAKSFDELAKIHRPNLQH